MSIPPLVCSTPPPPDQCEDEKIPDDFDIGYNLSQEYEEQSAYEFNGFSTFSTYKTTINSITIDDINTSKTTHNSKELVDNGDTECKSHEQVNIDTSPFEEKKIDEDNIEDLDLQFEDSSSLNIKESPKEHDKKTLDSDSGLTDTSTDIDHIETITSTPTFGNDILAESIDTGHRINRKYSLENHDMKDNEIPTQEKLVFTTKPAGEGEGDINQSEQTAVQLTGFINTCDESNKDVMFLNNNIYTDIKSEILRDTDNTSSPLKTDHILEASVNNEPVNITLDDDDDFGNFDDFQFTSDNDVSKNAIGGDNPWENNNVVDEVNDFKANFDGIHKAIVTKHDLSPNLENSLDSDENDDFDEFKSSDIDSLKTIEVVKDEQEVVKDLHRSYSLSPLDIHLSHNDTPITEIVDKVLCSVFEEEISLINSEPERILTSFLSETWGHLTEADVRQPYMVNWNNSLNQKALLKALCIDSRNILFGPKWSHNMPKYAANLGSLPLQPQKSNTSLPSSIEAGSSTSTQNTDNWVPPVDVGGQEFTYAEALLLDLEHLMATLDQMAHNHSSLKISDLLTSACSNDNGSTSHKEQSRTNEYSQTLPTSLSKPEKIYPNTLNLQPIRQINLPDTHIYTPTDSEIPRSKTIHYDNGAPILIPQTATETLKTSHNTPTNDVEDDEYSDFQDFQCGTNIHLQTVNPKPPDKGEHNDSVVENSQLLIPLETQVVLQPIKVEFQLPSLNWPDPGEVKETFNDFSDFTSHFVGDQFKENIVNESIVKDSVDSPSINIPLYGAVTNKNDAICVPTSIHTNFQGGSNILMPDVDDEFDTFQSAMPISHNSQAFQTLSADTKGVQKLIDSDRIQTVNLDCGSSRTKDNDFSDLISSDISQLNDSKNSNDLVKSKALNQIITTPSVSAIEKGATIKVNQSVMDNKILQPTPVNSAANHSKPDTGQILQPLSLESYTQINWPNPGINLQDLSHFNPVKTIQTIQAEASGSHSKNASPTHIQKNQAADDDMWSDFISVKPKVSPQPKKQAFLEDDEWSEFVSSPSLNPHNGLNTISLNVHTNLSIQKSLTRNKYKQENKHIDIPTLNYITPKSNTSKSYTDRHFQNL